MCDNVETDLVEFNSVAGHVHPLVNFPPKVAISKLVNSLKGVSSRRMRQKFPDLVRHYWRAQRHWSGSYFAGSVGGAPISVLHQYIKQQDRPVQGTLSRDRPPARAFTTGPKPGALAAIR
ncbi:putative transposase [Lentzea aerocolonigenes]|nr:putative transposase [Lentzea aerocolonigenes]